MPYLRVPNTSWEGIVDTGFGNRIQFWEVAYKLNKFNSFKFIILVDSNKWRETKFLNFPYTESSNIRFNNLKDLTEIDARYPWLHKLDTNKSWDIIDEWPPYREDGFYGKWLHLITLKDKVLEKKIKELVKDRVGIHIRHWTTGEMFRAVDQKYYPTERFKYVEKMNLVRKTLDKFPNSKFYVSTDITYNKPTIGPLLPDFRKEPHWLSEVYRDYDVVDYRDIISVDELLPTVIKDENNTKWSKIYDMDGEEDLEFMEINKIYDVKFQRDVIDLFSLIYSKEFITSSKTGRYSSWSEFVEIYRKNI